MEKQKLIRAQKGFTLVEVIIAIGVLGLVMTLTSGVLVSVVKAYQKQKVISEVERNGDFVIRILEERIRNAASVDCIGVDVKPDDSFDKIDTSVACDDTTRSVFLEIISHATDDPATNMPIYVGIANGTSVEAGRLASCNASESENRFLFMTEDTNHIIPTASVPESERLTNAVFDTGVCVDDFAFNVNDSGTPVQVIIDLSILDSVGTGWDVLNQFETFVTVRGSYK